MIHLAQLQGWLHERLAALMSGFAASGSWSLLASMLPVGVLFGAIHALMPGHGKTILAGYLVGSPLSILRGLAVAAVQAATHVGIAVAIALLALPLVSRTIGGAGRAPSLELVSRGLIIMIGLWLVTRSWCGRPHRHAESEGLLVGLTAGLIPCPLTLFAMVMAMAHGVPQVGVAFAMAMMIGVGLTLGLVAFLSVLARAQVVGFSARHGHSVARLSRLLDGVSGVALALIAAYDLA